MAREAAAEIELAPGLAVKVFVAHPTVDLVETVPIVVEIALVAPVEFVVGTASTAAGVALVAPVEFVVVPTAAASIDSVGISVFAEQQPAQHELCDHCECAARCITPGGSATQR